MDGIRGEVSNKIRSAIKAKLTELGAYVDDELPDYIMVMVANKRSKQQMEDDLQLFLGDSTVTFTAWLHSVLNKLQQVTINSSEMKNSYDKKRTSSDDHKKDKKKKAKRDKEPEKIEKTKTRDEEASKDTTDFHENNVKERVKNIKSEPAELGPPEGGVLQSDKEKKAHNSKGVAQQASVQQTLSKKHNDGKTTEDEDDDFINLKADVEADMWGEGEENPPLENNTQISQPLLLKPAASPTPIVPPPPVASVSASQNIPPVTTVTAKRTVTTKEPDPKPVARIIKISEAVRQEQETLNPVKHPSDPQGSLRKSRIPSPIIFNSEDVKEKEDDEEIFGRHIAHELKQLSKGQRNLAKLKIQQALAKRILLSHVVNQKTCPGPGAAAAGPGSEVRRSRAESRGAERRDLRQTLNKDRRKERGRGRDERERVRDRERKYSRERHVDRKHSSLSSIVRPRSQIAAQEEEEEEKTDASVASVVRVKPRPRLPSALQANCSLILKAVAEAQKSVHRIPLRPDPALHVPSKNLNANQKMKSAGFPNGTSKARRRDRGASNQSNPKTRLSEDAKGLQSSARLPPREALMKMSVTVPRKGSPHVDMVGADGSDNDSVVLDSPLNIMIQVPTSPLAPESAEQSNPAQTEKVLRWIEDVEEANKTGVLSHSNEIPEEQPNIVSMENDLSTDFDEVGAGQNNISTEDCEDSFQPDLVDESNDPSLDRAAVSQWSDDGDPQFVVTLDGIDPIFIQSFDNEEDARESVEQNFVEPQKNDEDEERHQQEQELRLRDELLKQQAAARENQRRQQLLKQQARSKDQKTPVYPEVETLPAPVDRTALKRSASPVNLVDSPPSKVLAKSSTPERCKFWPTCRHGDKCDFHHPSVPCKLFPNCKFADRCLYIHPNCKFNSSCSRLDCPYTHFGPRTAVSSSSAASSHPGGQSIKQTCKFYPNCNNRNCLFIHPTVCRFGLYCTKANCQFIHSDKALPTKHKWVRV